MTKTELKVAVGADSVSAVYEPSAGASDRKIVFVCAHGAGGNMMDRGMLATANALRARGIGVLRFNFLYSEKKSGRPDPMPRLRECISAVVSVALADLSPRKLLIGGRSMGGR